MKLKDEPMLLAFCLDFFKKIEKIFPMYETLVSFLRIYGYEDGGELLDVQKNP
jgi:hypothetical protein